MLSRLPKQILGQTKSIASSFRIGDLLAPIQKKLFGRFPKKFRYYLDKIGDYVPTDYILARSPVQKYVNQLLNVVSFGQFQKLMEKFNFDKFYHLYLIFTVNGEQYVIEKNEVLTISPYKVREGEDRLPIGNSPSAMTLKEALEKSIADYGEDTIVKYNPWTTNCQLFIKQFITSLGLSSDQANDFIYQDVSSLVSELNPYVKEFAEDLTAVAGTTTTIGQELGILKKGGLVMPEPSLPDT